MTCNDAACDDASRAAETAARVSYGRLLAWLAYRWRDVSAAEDALSEAFAAALRTWPQGGVPDAPEAWLMTAAKRNLLKAARSRRMASEASAGLPLPDEALPDASFVVPDERLRLMLVCAHPAIDPGMHTALMLQTVLGVDAARIARLFVVSPEAMTKRLVRVKTKIREARIRFEEPDAGDLPARLGAVLEAIYAAYTLDAVYDAPGSLGTDFTEEAMYLAGVVATLLPDVPEALGLRAMLLYSNARKAARLDADGRFVPLDSQDARRWSAAAIAEADVVLGRAAGLGSIGPFQIEAAIQSAHCEPARGRPTPWPAIVTLYDALIAMAPTLGARLGRAMALAHATGDPRAALAELDAMAVPGLSAHQPWWAVRAYLLEQAGDIAAAAQASREARALTTNPAVLRHFDERLARLGFGSA